MKPFLKYQKAREAYLEEKKKKLSRVQSEVYEFVRTEIDKNGFSPTHAEIAARFGHHSPSQSREIINRLIVKGFLHKRNNTWRGIYLPPKKLDMPDVVGFYWYFENNYAPRKPVEVVMNGTMELEQVEMGSCIRKKCKQLKGKWEFISS